MKRGEFTWEQEHRDFVLDRRKKGQSWAKVTEAFNEAFGTSYNFRVLGRHVDAIDPANPWEDDRVDTLFNSLTGMNTAKDITRQLNKTFKLNLKVSQIEYRIRYKMNCAAKESTGEPTLGYVCELLGVGRNSIKYQLDKMGEKLRGKGAYRFISHKALEKLKKLYPEVPEDWVDTKVAMKKLILCRTAVIGYITRGRLKAIKHGRDYMIDPRSLDQLAYALRREQRKPRAKPAPVYFPSPGDVRLVDAPEVLGIGRKKLQVLIEKHQIPLAGRNTWKFIRPKAMENLCNIIRDELPAKIERLDAEAQDLWTRYLPRITSAVERVERQGRRLSQPEKLNDRYFRSAAKELALASQTLMYITAALGRAARAEREAQDLRSLHANYFRRTKRRVDKLSYGTPRASELPRAA